MLRRIPIWGYPPLLVSFLIDSQVVQMAIVILFGAWFVGWAGTLWLSSTRMIFAAAFDRVLPEAAARVSDRGVPWIALLLIMVPGVILSWLYAYQAGFSALTLDASLVIAVTFFGTSFAATILPWWKADLYNKSPIARYKVAGVPMISIAGAITTIFLGWVVYEWLSNSLYGIGIGNAQSIKFLGIVYGLAALVWVVARRLPADPGDRPRRDPRGDPGGVTAASTIRWVGDEPAHRIFLPGGLWWFRGRRACRVATCAGCARGRGVPSLPRAERPGRVRRATCIR